MSLFRIYVKFTWHDRVLFNGYELIAAKEEKTARRLAKKRVFDNFGFPEMNKSQVSLRTSTKGFIS